MSTLSCVPIDFEAFWIISDWSWVKNWLPYFSISRGVVESVPFPEVWNRKGAESSLVRWASATHPPSPPGGQRLIFPKYQIHLPVIDTLVTGMASAAKYWPNFSFKISANFNFKILTKVLKGWTKSEGYGQTWTSKSATNCCQHDPHH